MNSLNSISTNHINTTIKVIPIDTCSCLQPIEDRLRVIIIEKGSGIGTLNGNAVSFNAPMIFCINETETFTITESNKLCGKLLSFHPSVLAKHFNYYNVRHFDHSFSVNDIKIIMDLSIFFNRSDNYIGKVFTSEPVIKHILKMMDHFSSSTECSPITCNKLLEIIAYIHRLVKTNCILASAVITETSFEVKDVLLYLHNNYKHKITIPELSKQFHVNRTTLSDRFFEATGETIITYLNKHRINLSTILLRESNLSVSDIADEVGFNDTAYFAKLFRKYMHHSPSGYRDRYYALSNYTK